MSPRIVCRGLPRPLLTALLAWGLLGTWAGVGCVQVQRQPPQVVDGADAQGDVDGQSELSDLTPGGDVALPAADGGPDADGDADAGALCALDCAAAEIEVPPCHVVLLDTEACECLVMLSSDVQPCLGDPACRVEVLDPETCACELVPVDDAVPCNDGNPCTHEDRCAGGTCLGKPLTSGEAALACDDQNPCTEDLCDPLESCAHYPTGGDCDDGDPCTDGEHCDGTVCTEPDQFVCGTCDVAAPDTCEADHGDGDPCNGTLICVAGQCRADVATVVTCEAGVDPCTQWACEPSTGECAATPRPDGFPCSDGSACTVDDACQEGACVGAPSSSGACSCAADEDCAVFDDQNLCNGQVLCLDGVCLFDATTIVHCGGTSAGACAITVCDPTTAACGAEWVPDETPCDDGDTCTGPGVCLSHLCQEAAPIDCSDLDGACVLGECDAELGCVASARADGHPCPVADACHAAASCAGGVCVQGEATDCADADACTIDVCDPVDGCQHLGPSWPACAEQGVCAAGVQVVCDGGSYRCAPEQLSDWSPIDLCGDELDNDCDGETDEADCATSGGCAVGLATTSYGAGMTACAATGLLHAEAVCGDGWHVCTWSQLKAQAGSKPVPKGFWLAASVAWDAATQAWSAADSGDGACQEFEGECGQTHAVQAMTWPGQYQGAIAYAAEAWGCAAGEPTETCETVALAGVMCCVDACADDADCDDGDPCTDGVCEPATGECVTTPHNEVSCPSVGVCAAAPSPKCDPGTGLYGCDPSGVSGWEATEASCDGLDNDCDGLTDAQDPDLLALAGPPCGKAAGVCAGALKDAAVHCVGGKWTACSNQDYELYDPRYSATGEKLCDGVDENCDGEVDEAFAWSAAPVGQPCEVPGVCGAGIVVCQPDAATATCSTHPDAPGTPAADEACNGDDDDCDGAVDEAAELDPAAAGCAEVGVCKQVAPSCVEGGWSCPYAAIPTWLEDSEICDGLDNDCDGETDEGFVYLDPEDGVAKAKGDDCGSVLCPGKVVCAGSSSELLCSSGVGSPEVCDGLDNDCDGVPDGGLEWLHPGTGVPHALGDPCFGLGACAVDGLVECTPGGQAVCSSQPGGSGSPATGELCNALDDDCDGATDNGLAYQGTTIGGPCDGVGACGLGVVECTATGLVGCSTDSGGTASHATGELCNGLDDDCDGVTDEAADLDTSLSGCAYTGVCTPQNVLASCLAGEWTCDYSGAVPAGYHAGTEIGPWCDGKDNDCDGLTDEDFLEGGLDAPCDGEDADLCAGGVGECSADHASVTCAGDVPVFEACNGVDDDCDGDTDEAGAAGCGSWWFDGDGDGWGGAGEPVCTCASGDVAGYTAPASGDCLDGAAAVHPEAPELCDGEDNDCDGLTDGDDGEDLLSDDATSCQDTVGVCAEVGRPPYLCQGGAWQPCDAEVYAGAAEAWEASEATCDGLDNDCDGAIDADDPDLAVNAPLCSSQAGVCAGAKRPASTCAGGAWPPCGPGVYAEWSQGAWEQGEEQSCDGLDNDCDGVTDDPFSYLGAKVKTACDGVGACGSGEVQCAPGGGGATCSTNPDGTASEVEVEVCNDADDDCDGETDEGLGAAQSTCFVTGVCTPQSVVATCDGGQWSCGYAGVPGFEGGQEQSCDGLDNDCDGFTDEDFVAQLPDGTLVMHGDPCGDGDCVGVMVCDESQAGIECSSESTAGEACDGEDDDCDGRTDEGLTWQGTPLGQACEGLGVCGQGVVECSDTTLQPVCSSMPGGSASGASGEVCNDVDDDCDGQTDDGVLWQGQPVGAECDGVGACGPGTVVCAPGSDVATCSTNPDGTDPEVEAEICNGQDDDCDGHEDEGLGFAASDCLAGGVCGPTTVIATCEGDAGWSCEYTSPHFHPGDEIGHCDDLDNDCDGATDEDYPELGEPCDRPDDLDECELGTWTCADGGGVMCIENLESPELCATPEDDDCDGETNEEGAADCVVFWYDGDGDSYGSQIAGTRCLCPGHDVPHWTASNNGDCDDERGDVNPDAPEVCSADGISEDCDAEADEEGALGCTWYATDLDGDGWGSESDHACLCGPSAPWVLDDPEAWSDCKDLDPFIHPDAQEVCDNVDHDCDGDMYALDAVGCTHYLRDMDDDDYGVTGDFVCACFPDDVYRGSKKGDCCDDDAQVHPTQDGWFAWPNQCGDYDYDCDEDEIKEWQASGYCKLGYLLEGQWHESCPDKECESACQGAEGWYSKLDPGDIGIGDGGEIIVTPAEIPQCGGSGFWITSCKLHSTGGNGGPTVDGCQTEGLLRQQRCH